MHAKTPTVLWRERASGDSNHMQTTSQHSRVLLQQWKKKERKKRERIPFSSFPLIVVKMPLLPSSASSFLLFFRNAVAASFGHLFLLLYCYAVDSLSTCIFALRFPKHKKMFFFFFLTSLMKTRWRLKCVQSRLSYIRINNCEMKWNIGTFSSFL